MLSILQTFEDSWLVSDSPYSGGGFDEEAHEETVPMDFHGMRVPEVSPRELWEGYDRINPDGIKGRCKNWTAIGPVLKSMDVRLTSTFVHEGRADAVSVGRFSVAHSDQVPSVLQYFTLCLLTGRIGMEEDETKRLTYFVLDEQRCKGREPFNIEDYRGKTPRDEFDGIALALREMGLVRSFEPSLIKVTRADGNVLWGRIDNGLRIAHVEAPGEMTIPGTELVAPKDASERIKALQEIWVGVGEDKSLAFKARAAMAWAISVLPPQGKIMTWFDGGGTGKTSFIAGFNACFPSKSTSVNWQALDKVGQFEEGLEVSHLIGKTVSFSDETSQLGKKEGALSNLKALSTGATKTARFGAGRSAEVYLKLWQVLFSNVGSIFPKGFAFERRLVHMPLVSEVAARRIPLEMHGDKTLGDWLFSEAEVGKTFMALACAGKRIWEEEFNCAWPKALEKWEGEEDDTSDNQFCLPPKGSDIYLDCLAVASVLKSNSRLFVDGLRKLARVWNKEDGYFYGDYNADSSVTGRVPRTFMLLDEKTTSFNSTLTAGHDPSTVSGFIPDATDGTVKNFAKMAKELGIEFNTISKKPAFYTGGKPTMRAPHAEDSSTWKAVRIVLGVQAYGPAVYEAPEVEVPVENEEDVTPTITPVDATPTILTVDETQSTPVDETPIIPPVPSPIHMPREEQQAIHEAFGAEGELIAVDPETKLPKGRWSLKAKADGTSKTVKTWPAGEQACAFIPTGKTVLLDLDCHGAGPSGWEVLNKEIGSYGSDSFPKTLGELTPSGGIHLLYNVQDASFVERLKSVSHVDGVEVDIKVGGKGQAVCAGSKTTKGRYRVCSLPEGDTIAEISEAMKSWLARKGYVGEDPLAIERRRKEEEAKRAAIRAEREARRAQGEEPTKPRFLQEMEAEFDKAIDEVATSASGGRNSALNEVSFKLFSKSKKYYADFSEDWLDDEVLKERLVAAGLESGLDKSEVIATVESAWAGVFGGTTTVVAPVIEPVIEPEEDVEVQTVVNEDLRKATSKGESLFQAAGYAVDWRGNFHKTSQEELEAIHEDDGWGNSGEPVDKTETSQEELNDLHEDDGPYTNGSRFEDLFDDDESDGWVNADYNVYEVNYPIVPLEDEIGEEDLFPF